MNCFEKKKTGYLDTIMELLPLLEQYEITQVIEKCYSIRTGNDDDSPNKLFKMQTEIENDIYKKVCEFTSNEK